MVFYTEHHPEKEIHKTQSICMSTSSTEIASSMARFCTTSTAGNGVFFCHIMSIFLVLYQYLSQYSTSYFCWVSPARMRILWTSMLALSESPDHQEETIFNMLEADQPLVSSHLNFNVSRSPISSSVTSRNEWVLFVAIFSFLSHKNREKC